MASDKHRPSTPSWKTTVPSNERKREAQPTWKKETAAPTKDSGRWTRKTKIIAGSVAFFAFNALLIWVIYWLWPPKPACLVLIGAGYEENLAVPHNVYGWQGLAGLADLSKTSSGSFFSWGSSLLQLRFEPRELRSDVEWDRGLDDFKERTVILFLALHGSADSQGPYLLPHDFDYEKDEKQRLPVSRVLDTLERVPANKKKVLLLDATQVPAHWSLGMLHNNFARELRGLKERIDKIPNLVVLCASDDDQRSWVSEELRKTVFAHYVIEGLKGAADELPSGDRNGRVDALELHQYVSRNVERWARNHRDALQTPMLLGGEDRAREIELVVVKERYDTEGVVPQAGDVPVFEAPAELVLAWKKYQALEKQTPAPATYTPQLWRQYVDTLLRYEQLVRAGDTRKVQELKTELDRLEDVVKRQQRLEELHSVKNTLAMPAALGIASPWSEKELARFLDDLWKAKGEEYDRKWEQIEKQAPDNRQKLLLSLAVTNQLLERAAERPREGLDKACQLLKVARMTGNRRPAEAHYLALLNRDVARERGGQPLPPDTLLTKALQLRRLAENVALALPRDGPRKPRAPGLGENPHPYSEQVFPWIQGKVTEADELRRRGEDRLFATERDAWNRAEQDLQQAEDLFRLAQADADKVRKALHTRDEVLVSLPYYAHWLARRRVLEEAEQKAFEDLWREAHYLVRLLEDPNPRRINEAIALNEADTNPRALAAQTEVLRKQFKALEDVFALSAAELSGAALQSVWRDTDDALVVPRLDPDLRMKLLKNARAVSREFHIQSATSEASGMSREKNGALARQAAQRQGRMALAVLGQRWFDDPALFVGRASEKFAEVENRIHKFHTEERWWVSLMRAEEEVGFRWRRMPLEINKRVDGSRKENLSSAAAALETAERIARQMDGAGARSLTSSPAQENRRLHVHHLLLWQAQRTRHDHWFAEDPAAEPYYQFAGNVYVQDARALVSVKGGDPREQKERLQQVLRMEEQLKQPGELTAAGPSRLEVTSERRIPVEYQLQADARGWVPAGYPVVWLDTGKFLDVSGERGRRVLEIKDKEASASLSFYFSPELPAQPPRVPRTDKTESLLHGVFRGQKIEKKTPINLHRLPETIVYRQPAPLPAGIAVRAAPEIHDQFAPEKGAIAIVLDCSGSMMKNKDLKTDEDFDNFRKNYNKKSPCNYHEATQALRRVLEQIPKGTRVSVSVFSHKIEGVTEQPNPNDTIAQFRPPIAWNPAELPALLDRLESLEPWNETPVVRAMWRAKSDGFPPGFKGFKTLLVLTDGEDNQFKNDRQLQALHKTDLIPKFIDEEFKDFGVVINLVGFKVAAGEETRFRDQFKNAIEKLPLAGKFYTVNDAAQLAEKLTQSIKQKLRFQIEREGGGFLPEMPEDGWDVRKSTEPDFWVPLAPGPYKVRVQTNKVLEQRIHLSKGEYLLISITADGLGYERILLGDDYNRSRLSQEVYDWMLTVLQSQLKPDKALEMLVTLENRKDRAPKNGTLRQVRPQVVWLEVKPQGSEEPIAMRWGDAQGYAAPAWNIDVPLWPARAGAAEPARPFLTAWWNWEEDAPVAATLKRPPSSDFETGFRGRDVLIGNDVADKASIDSIQIEDHPIETKSGTKETVSCLVIRGTYPPGKPIWVKTEGLEIQGEEHRFYTQASRYTGIFWAVRKDAARDQLKALHLVALDRFKRMPSTTRLELKFTDAPDTQPRPPTVPEVIEK